MMLDELASTFPLYCKTSKSRFTATSPIVEAPPSDAAFECKFCQQLLPEACFLAKQLQRLWRGKSGCCQSCQQLIDDLKVEATALAPEALLDADSHGSDKKVLQRVQEETLQFWRTGLQKLVASGIPSSASAMLEQWIQMALEAQTVAATSKVAQLSEEKGANLPKFDFPPHLQEWLDGIRRERKLIFDVEKYPFDSIMREVFETEDLTKLHLAPLSEEQKVPLCPTLLRAYHSAGRKRPRSWRRAVKHQDGHIRRFRQSKAFRSFMATFRKFVQEVIVPFVDSEEPLLVQWPPTLRCQMPSVIAMGAPHRDSDFDAHHGAEINFWVPVTPVWGSNSLQTESEPGKEDFHPFELEFGEFMVFNGSRCLHYTLPNSTNSVRISFDFRVIPMSAAKNWRHQLSAGTTSELAMYDFVQIDKR